MIYYRALKDTDPIIIEPVAVKHELIDLIYSNAMPSHTFFKEERQVWSFAKTPEAALDWFGPRGKGKYNRLAYYDFKPQDGELYDLTELATWVSLIEKSQNGLQIHNLNCNTFIEAVRSIIPCMRSAYSMARACEEVVFIPSKRVCLTVVEDLAKMQIPRNAEDAESVLAETQFNNKTIDDLLLQLQGYSIRPLLRDALKALKVA